MYKILLDRHTINYFETCIILDTSFQISEITNYTVMNIRQAGKKEFFSSSYRHLIETHHCRTHSHSKQ